MSDVHKFSSVNTTRSRSRVARQEEFIKVLAESGSLDTACAAADIVRQTYSNWRNRYPEFAARADLAKLATLDAELKGAGRWTHGFAAFRERYFRMQTTWFQQKAVSAYENVAPGNILMILWPPEHGKTTLFEDYAGMKLATNPSWRFTVGSEKQLGMSRKILARVKARMEPTGPFREYVQQWGPFKPDSQLSGVAQPWGADFFSVFRKGGFDERDYSMVALGMTSTIAGTRTDHLHVDDPQSLKSLPHTEKYVETFRQDWLTRPGEHGITTINGTRVGENDFYETLIDELPSNILKVIKFPVITYDEARQEMVPLWEYDERTGAGYTMEMLDRLRAKVGEEAWSRNYMQNPIAGAIKAYTKEVVEPCRRSDRTIDMGAETGYAVLTLDPALGSKNCICALEFLPQKLRILNIHEQTGLARNEQIMEQVELAVVDLLSKGTTVTDLVIEAKNFQAGLARDERLVEMQLRYGFSIHEHLTGDNKYDENIGVPSMALNFRRQNVEIPWGDEESRRKMDQFEAQLYAWRPGARGNKLRQDQVMAFWFGWILWRQRAVSVEVPSSSFNYSGLPYKPTSSGLLTPVGALR